MRAEVYFAGQPVGTLLWQEDAYGVRVELDCACPPSAPALLRCYGETAGAPLLVGLPEPQGGRLRLVRHLSRETLKVAGCLQTPPGRFYLSEKAQDRPGPEPPPADAEAAAPLHTGDAVLDSLLDSGAVQVEPDGTGLVLRCPFAPDQPFALAPAFVLCTVESGLAELRWTKKDAAGPAASSSEA